MDLLHQNELARRGLVDTDLRAAKSARDTSPPTEAAALTHDEPENATNVDHRALRDGSDVAATGDPKSESGDTGDDLVLHADQAAAEASAAEVSHRRRRSFAQRAAAAQDKAAALEAERRRMRTRGAIIAGALLVRLAKSQPAVLPDLAVAIGALQERDREALRQFSSELGA